MTNIEEAIEVLKAAGYRVSRPRQRKANSNGTTTAWPPKIGQRYVGPWPPAFRTPGVCRPTWMKMPDYCKPLPEDWAERTATIGRFMSQEARCKS